MKVWTTASSKALKLFNEIPFQDRPCWRLRCDRLYCPSVELLKSMTAEGHSGKVVPEFRRRPVVWPSRSLLTLSRRLRLRICCWYSFNCPLSFSSSRFYILSWRHHL